MIRQKEIAEHLGVSIMTVSRALRNHPDLARTTKDRVLRKAAELGYVGAAPAAATARRRVGILAYEDSERPLFGSQVQQTIFQALQKECRRNKFETVIEVLHRGEAPLLLKEEPVGALFIFGRYDAETVSHFRDVPALALSSFTTGDPLPSIVADNFGGAREATSHLISQGHRRILFVGEESPHTEIFRLRGDGYLSAMHAHGLAPELLFLPSGTLAEHVPTLRRYTAVACASDSMAHDLIQGAGAALPVPEACSVVGFDNLTRDGHKDLTTYAPDWEMMGRLAAELLLFRPHDLHRKNIKVIVPGRMVYRNSVRKISN